MQVYADLPARRTRQVLVDALAVLWIVGAIWFAKQVYDLVLMLQAPGRTLESSGTALADSMQGASDRVDGVPLAGRALSAPFQSAADAANALASAGQSAQGAVNDVAWLLALLIGWGAVFLALLLWALPRFIWVRRASAARAVLLDRDGADLLALRALATRPLRQLAVVGTDGVLDRWRRGDQETIDELATLELTELGLDRRRLPAIT